MNMNYINNFNQMMNNQMMNYQMNQNIQNNINQNEVIKEMHIFLFNRYEKNLDTLTDQKKLIIFKDPLKNKKLTAQIPISFTKNDLYTFANGRNMRNILLLYENNILNDDNSSINDIPDNATISLFFSPSFYNYKQSGLYKYLCNFYPNSQIYNICADLNGKKNIFHFPSDFSISLMIKLFRILLDIKEEDVVYLYCMNKLDANDDRKIGDLSSCENFINITIIPTKNYVPEYFAGKEIKVVMFFKNNNIFKFYKVTKYSSISHLFSLNDDLDKKKILYNGKELNKNDNHSLASLGINDDFACIVE